MSKIDQTMLALFIVSIIFTVLMIFSIENQYFSFYLTGMFIILIPFIYSLIKSAKKKDATGVSLVLLIPIIGVPYVIIRNK